jgi:hypothetical protein
MDYVIPKIIEDLRNGVSADDVKYYYFGMADEIGDLVGDYGAIFVNPLTTDIEARATGVLDMNTDDIEIVLVKSSKMEVYESPDKPGSVGFLTRVMAGRESVNSSLTSSILYIVRNNMRNYGVREIDFSIDWNDKRFIKEGIVAATLNIKIESLLNQPII